MADLDINNMMRICRRALAEQLGHDDEGGPSIEACLTKDGTDYLEATWGEERIIISFVKGWGSK